MITAYRAEITHRNHLWSARLLQSCGERAYIAPSVIITPAYVTLGNDCAINEFVHILGGGQVTMGNGVWIASHASIVSVSHPSDVEFIGEHPQIAKPIVIEDNVWIGSHAIILPGVTLGRSCVVGAGSVVTQDVPPYAIVVGAPARVLRMKKVV